MIHPTDEGVLIDVRVIPRASRSGIAGTHGGALLVRLRAPPVGGAANDELVEVVAKALGVPKGAVSIVSGARARQKRLLVCGISEADLKFRLSRRKEQS